MRLEYYFDHAATTPLDPRILEEMLPYLREDFGNAHSIHAWGKRVEAAVELARERIAGLIGAEDPNEIYFTSGATEANNWVFSLFEEIWVSPFEHSSIHEQKNKKVLRNEVYRLFPPSGPLDSLSVMLVNNETGAILELPEGVVLGTSVHRDITQGLGKIPIDVLGLDYASMSAHKLYGPKGIGALYARTGAALKPLLKGGEQEHGARAGTLNVPGIVGFGAACAMAAEEMQGKLVRAQRLREVVFESLSGLSDWQENSGENFSPYILSLSFLGVEGESLVIDLDAMGFGVSSGAACSSRKAEPSHVLLALGLREEWLRGTVRISFGQANTLENARALGRALARSVENLRGLVSRS